ncbi:hypothetical protein [Streptomyces sp. NRRL S-1022]|uniref:hypothetical protein n=1 Tax=Streptomyces sp. NRRL S-1022 TaxID=1463880 RepID=UPI002D21AFC0|nr:hypothetical protein [Streptomyces sp. NRRL S-1022]
MVTGSVRGPGPEMARGPDAAGAHVVLDGRHPVTLARAAARLWVEGGHDGTAAAFDVTDRDAAEQAPAGPDGVGILVGDVGDRDRRARPSPRPS